MILVITSIELKSPLGFFTLSAQARHIVRQVKKTPCIDMKASGFWTKHYTMTLWETESDMESFAKSGAHLKAIKRHRSYAKEIRTTTISMDHFPSWKDAKSLLKKAKSYHAR